MVSGVLTQLLVDHDDQYYRALPSIISIIIIIIIIIVITTIITASYAHTCARSLPLYALLANHVHCTDHMPLL